MIIMIIQRTKIQKIMNILIVTKSLVMVITFVLMTTLRNAIRTIRDPKATMMITSNRSASNSYLSQIIQRHDDARGPSDLKYSFVR